MRTGSNAHKLIVVLVFILATAEGIANDGSGVVVSARGEVSATADGESRLLTPGNFINEHDTWFQAVSG
jgi:hypothetical protein